MIKDLGNGQYDLGDTKSTCPYCGRKQDGATSAGKMLNDDFMPTGPEEGSISLCLYCANISQFGKDLQLEKISAELLETIRSENPEIAKQIDKVQIGIMEKIIDRTIDGNKIN